MRVRSTPTLCIAILMHRRLHASPAAYVMRIITLAEWNNNINSTKGAGPASATSPISDLRAHLRNSQHRRIAPTQRRHARGYRPRRAPRDAASDSDVQHIQVDSGHTRQRHALFSPSSGTSSARHGRAGRAVRRCATSCTDAPSIHRHISQSLPRRRHALAATRRWQMAHT